MTSSDADDREAILPIVIASVKSYPPAFRSGGPTRSVAALAEELEGEIDFRVITSIDDNGHDLRKDGIEPLVWEHRAYAQVSALPLGTLAPLRMVETLRSVDAEVLYLNSLFHPVFSLVPLLARRVGLASPGRTVISPRGELDPGALLLSPKRKRMVLAILRILRLVRGVRWHATSDVEAQNIRRVFGEGVDVKVASNLRTLEVVEPIERPLGASLRVVFMSKIDRKKNLETAADAVARCTGATLTVIGPIKDESYWSEVLARVESSGLGDRFSYVGEVSPELIVERLAEFDAFLLPSHGENFGHAILEALAAGLPVVLSDTTPWNQVEVEGAGWVRSPQDVQGFAECLRLLVDQDGSARYEMRKNSARVARQFVDDSAPVDVYRDLFFKRIELV